MQGYALVTATSEAFNGGSRALQLHLDCGARGARFGSVLQKRLMAAPQVDGPMSIGLQHARSPARMKIWKVRSIDSRRDTTRQERKHHTLMMRRQCRKPDRNCSCSMFTARCWCSKGDCPITPLAARARTSDVSARNSPRHAGALSARTERWMVLGLPRLEDGLLTILSSRRFQEARVQIREGIYGMAFKEGGRDRYRIPQLPRKQCSRQTAAPNTGAT